MSCVVLHQRLHSPYFKTWWVIKKNYGLCVFTWLHPSTADRTWAFLSPADGADIQPQRCLHSSVFRSDVSVIAAPTFIAGSKRREIPERWREWWSIDGSHVLELKKLITKKIQHTHMLIIASLSVWISGSWQPSGPSRCINTSVSGMTHAGGRGTVIALLSPHWSFPYISPPNQSAFVLLDCSSAACVLWSLDIFIPLEASHSASYQLWRPMTS